MGHPVGKSNRYYSKEEKLRIVKEVMSGRGSKDVGRETGVGDRLIRSWITLYMEQGEAALENKRSPGNPLCRYSNKKDMSEVEQLRYELAKAELELAKLKKVCEVERRRRQPRNHFRPSHKLHYISPVQFRIEQGFA